jgi:hypothetical protein
MKKSKNLDVKIISTNNVETVIKRAEQGEFDNMDEVIVGDPESIGRLLEILDGLDDDGNPIKKPLE